MSFHGGPWFRPDPHRPDGGAESATGPDAELPAVDDITPKTTTFTWTGFRGLPIDHGHAAAGAADLPRSPRRGRPRRGRRRGARPWAGAGRLADLAAPAIRENMLGLLRPGPAPDLYVLPDDAPFAHERVVTALQFLLDADRYAEGNNLTRARELLASAATVAAHRTPPAAPVDAGLTTERKARSWVFTDCSSLPAPRCR